MRPSGLSRRLVPAFALLALASFGPASGPRTARAEDAPKDEKEPAKHAEEKKDDAPPLVAAEKGRFAVVLDLEGVLDAVGAVPVDVHTDAYDAALDVALAPILEAGASGGVPVAKDQLLVTFDPEKLDEQLAAARREVAQAKAGLDRAREELRRDEADAARVLARAKVEKERTEEALAYFKNVARAKRTTEAELELKSMNDSISDQQEELEQLRKMYKADDVVEETEKIVMARSERSLERSLKYRALRIESQERLLKVELPRELEDLEHAAASAAAGYEKALATSPLDLEKARRDLAKAELDLERQTKGLAKLEADRRLLEVKAPVAGTLFFGALADGKWSGGDDVAKALRKKEGLRTHQVLFTIVPAGPLALRTSVPEASVLDVKPGQTAEVTLAARPSPKVGAKVVSVSRTSDGGKFDVVLALGEADDRLVPGFAAKLKLTTVTKEDAITVPEESVTTKGDAKRVHVLVDGKPVAREVEVGATSGGRTEILKGLEAGTKVLESPPK